MNNAYMQVQCNGTLLILDADVAESLNLRDGQEIDKQTHLIAIALNCELMRAKHEANSTASSASQED